MYIPKQLAAKNFWSVGSKCATFSNAWALGGNATSYNHYITTLVVTHVFEAY
jgi:hypothetical protein